jgi:hypothetical protein
MLLGNVLAKDPASRSTVFVVGEADLLAVEELAGVLLRRDNVTAEQRHRKIMLLASTLGRVRQELIPGYVRRMVTMNVSPPILSGGPMAAGMDPDAIKDPVAREAYKAAILENEINNLTNIRQRKLYAMNRALSRSMIRYFVEVGEAHPEICAVILASATEARFTSDELARMAGRQ